MGDITMQPGPFWNRYVALWVVIVCIAVTVLYTKRDDLIVFAGLGFPLILAGTISHAFRNKIFFYVPWPFRSYTFNNFERWSYATGAALFFTSLLIDLLRHGK